MESNCKGEKDIIKRYPHLFPSKQICTKLITFCKSIYIDILWCVEFNIWC